MVSITVAADGLLLPVQAKPKASRSEVVGAHAGRLKVTAAAEKGKANAAVLDVLAAALGLRRSQLSLVAGETDPRKTALVTGVDADDLRRRIAAAPGE